MHSITSRGAGVAAALVIVLLAACGDSTAPGTAKAPGGDPGTSSSPEQPSGSRFVSERYGYSLTVPLGWEISPALEDLQPGAVPPPNSQSVDRFSPTDANNTLLAGSAPVRPGAGVGAHANRFAKRLRKGYPACGTYRSREELTLDGEDAVLMTWHCSDGYLAMNVLSVHEGEGFVVGFVAASGTPEENRHILEDALATFSFD